MGFKWRWVLRVNLSCLYVIKYLFQYNIFQGKLSRIVQIAKYVIGLANAKDVIVLARLDYISEDFICCQVAERQVAVAALEYKELEDPNSYIYRESRLSMM